MQIKFRVINDIIDNIVTSSFYLSWSDFSAIFIYDGELLIIHSTCLKYPVLLHNIFQNVIFSHIILKTNYFVSFLTRKKANECCFIC